MDIGGQAVPLAEIWYVVVQPSVLNQWVGDSRPAFSDRTKCVTINKIIDAYGGKDDFNELVKELLAIDYYEAWIEQV